MTSNSKLTTDREHMKHKKTKILFPKIIGGKCRLKTSVEKIIITHK